jgi:hypothetical protein
VAENREIFKGIGEDCINFYDIERNLTVCLVPYPNLPAVPRIGERVNLPDAQYQVRDVQYYYREDRQSDRPESACPAELYAIHVDVKKLADL